MFIIYGKEIPDLAKQYFKKSIIAVIKEFEMA